MQAFITNNEHERRRVSRENRLIEVYPDSPGAGSKKLVFDYDYMGRRVRKRVYNYNTGTSTWEETATKDLKFVYDQWTLDTSRPFGTGREMPEAFGLATSQGWNGVLVLDGTQQNDPVDDKYTWGLDLSGLSGQNPERERGGRGRIVIRTGFITV